MFYTLVEFVYGGFIMDHTQNLLKAINLSKVSIDAGSSPFGAIIVDKDGKIIGQGHNRVVLDNDPTAHGEVMAIRDACKNINSFENLIAVHSMVMFLW